MSNNQDSTPKQPNNPILASDMVSDLPSEGNEGEFKPKRSGLKRFCRFLLWFFVLLGILLLLVAGILGWMYHSIVTSPIESEKIEKAAPTELAGWLILRDLEKETPEVKSKLAEKYFKPIQKDVEIDMDSPAAQKFLPLTKKYMESREKTLADWEAENERRPFSRREYKVLPGEDHRRVILSTDVVPTDELRASLQEIADSGRPSVPAPGSLLEGNIRVLMKNWFLKQIADYDKAPENEKFAAIVTTVEQLHRVQNLYNDYLEKIGLSRQTDLEMLRDFDYMTSSWYDSTDPEELARLLWFKDLVVSVIIAKRAGFTPPKNLILRPEEKESALGGMVGGFFKRAESEKTKRIETREEKNEKAEENKSDEPDFF